MAKIALADMIEELRNELQDAMERGAGRSLRFELGEITVEAEVEVTRGAEGKAGLKFWVFTSAEAGASVGRAHTQKIVLTLKPRAEGGKDILVGRTGA